MLVSLSGCGCYLDLSPGNNKGTLCSSVWHQRPTWTENEGGREGAYSEGGGVGVSKTVTVRNKEEKKKEGRVLPIWHKEKPGSNRVSTCWEIDSLAVRDYCHVKRTVKMKETGPVKLIGSQLGLPVDKASIERQKYSHRPRTGAVYHSESAFVSFSFGKGVYLLSSVP